jgi:hypothetical protein
MRHTRKMVMIPEAEYKTLLNLMTKTGDDLQNEKTKLDAKIATTLANPKLEPELKQKRYNVLYKQRRQMRDMIENRPQKVLIQNPKTVPPNVAPYLGLTTSTTPNAIDTTSANEDERKKVIRRASTLGSTSGTEKSSVYTSSSAHEDEGGSTQYESALTPSEHDYRMPATTRKKLIALIEANPQRFGVAPNGQILSNKKLRIRESHFKDSIDYIAGMRDSPPRGHKFFEQTLRKDAEAQNIIMGNFEGQSGKGKKHQKKLRFAAKVKIIKTPGLHRIPPQKEKKIFKPQIWAKL